MNLAGIAILSFLNQENHKDVTIAVLVLRTGGQVSEHLK